MTTGGLDVQSVGSSFGSCSAPKVEEPPSTDNVVDGLGRLGINGEANIKEEGGAAGGGVQVTCFTEVLDDVTLHLQIIRLHKQIYAWIGCNSAKFGHLYAAAPTRPHNAVSVSSILGGAPDNTGSGIARRIVLKTGLNVILACNIPKNSPMLEADAEKMLVQRLISLDYTMPKYNGLSS